MSDDKPARWVPARNSVGKMRPVMAVPSKVDDKGNVIEYRVWPDGSPDREHNAQKWRAETFRTYFKPERDGQ